MGMKKCVEMVVADERCKKCTPEMKANNECSIVEQLFNYATRGDMNCGCPNKDAAWDEQEYETVDYFKVAYKTTKTEIKAGEWTKYEDCGDDETCAGYRGV